MQNRIKQIRKNHGLTQEDMAKRLQMTQSAIAAYENGRRAPHSSIIAAICREFNIREEWLRTGEGPMQPVRSRQEELMFLVGQAIAEGNETRLSFLSLGLRMSPQQVELLKDLALQLAAQFQQNEKEPES